MNTSLVRRFTTAAAAATAVTVATLTGGLMSAPALADTEIVDVGDFFFEPENMVISLNDTIRWEWIGNIPHTSTAARGQAEFWDSGFLGRGASFEHTFTNVGRFGYYCVPHGSDLGGGRVSGMAGTISVVDATGLLLGFMVYGDAGADNAIAVNGGTPGGTIFLVYGFRSGSTPVPGCPGVSVGIAAPTIAGNTSVDADGRGEFSVFVPGAASGRTVLLQAVDAGACSVSNIQSVTF